MDYNNENNKYKNFSFNLIAHRMNIGADFGDFNQVDNSFNALQNLMFFLMIFPDLKNIIKGFECDVRLTKDKELVVLHEKNIKTITEDRIKTKVNELTYKQLNGILLSDVNWYYNWYKFKALLLPDAKKLRKIINEKLDKNTFVLKALDMIEYLSSIGYKGEILIELKEQTDECRDAVIELINAYKSKLNFAVQSYDIKRTLYIGESTETKIGILDDRFHLSQKSIIDEKFISTMPFDFYSLIFSKVKEEKLKALIENDKQLYVWTIRDASILLKILKLLENFYNKYSFLPQSTSIITDIPLLINEYLTEENPNFKSQVLKNTRIKHNNLYN